MRDASGVCPAAPSTNNEQITNRRGEDFIRAIITTIRCEGSLSLHSPFPQWLPSFLTRLTLPGPFVLRPCVQAEEHSADCSVPGYDSPYARMLLPAHRTPSLRRQSRLQSD